MKTPYDAPLRVAERELDAVRTDIGKALDELQRVEQALVAIDAALAREAVVAAADTRMVAERYFARARDQRSQLGTARVTAQGRLEALRAKAVECYGSRKAIESAATRYRIEAEHAAVAAEQSALDDMVAARRIRRRPAMTIVQPLS
ncbi:hypothetical protein [Sphingomonas mollis]|uniref:Flagellar FliJ protein n=1 Tax=Sphingomonas mollis TaxID=2795726 RepID=A0ABS0XPX7_9SPHN|nr:hypothetical protein [Sphingomonas sp. BT553]MBJ6122078.1 hypothetical protein [Sphingomonas sp. BT553]